MDPVHPLLLLVQERKYGLKDVYMFNVPKAEGEMKMRCISVVGLRVWKNADLNLNV